MQTHFFKKTFLYCNILKIKVAEEQCLAQFLGRSIFPFVDQLFIGLWQ